MTTNKTNQPTTVADLHAGLHNTLRSFFHGKIDESTVIERVQFMAMLGYPTTDAHQVQEQMDKAREDYQNDDGATVEDFIQALNAIEQTDNKIRAEEAERKAADVREQDDMDE